MTEFFWKTSPFGDPAPLLTPKVEVLKPPLCMGRQRSHIVNHITHNIGCVNILQHDLTKAC